MFRWLRRWFSKAKTRQAILYTRAGCHLCDIAAETLRQGGYTTNLVDIDEDAMLKSRFDHEVPVVEIEGRIRFRGHVDPLLLKRLG